MPEKSEQQTNATHASDDSHLQDMSGMAHNLALSSQFVSNPNPNNAAQVIALQQTVGNTATRSVMRRVTSVPQIKTDTSEMLSRYKIIRRKELNANEILSSLDDIEFIKKKLDKSLRSGRRSAKATQTVDMDGTQKRVEVFQYKGPREQIRLHVEKSLANFQNNLKGDNADKNQAIMMAIVLDNVAKVIADELFEPALKPQLAKKLMELYQSDIQNALPDEMTNKDNSLRMASAMISDDPVSLYMHHEMRLDKARESIYTMAQSAGIEPLAMFDMLSQKWQAEIASYTRDQVENEQDDATAYSIRESTGELSVRYFEELFGDGVAAPTFNEDGNLELTDESGNRLAALRAEVERPTEVSSGMSGAWGITSKQDQHLREVEAADKENGVKDDARQRLINFISGTLGFTVDQATQMLPRIETWLTSAPLTITVHGHHWFGQAPTKGNKKYGLFGKRQTTYHPPTGNDAKFRPATAFTVDKDYSEIFEKDTADGTLTHSGEYTHPTYKYERGRNTCDFVCGKTAS